MEDSVVKGDMCWFDITMSRYVKDRQLSPFVALSVYVKTAPEVEAFFADTALKTFGDAGLRGNPVDPADWIPLNTAELRAYPAIDEFRDDCKNYNLIQIGSSLSVENQDGNMVPNISFLRLKGIGAPQGVSFGLPSPVSPALGKEWGNSITTAVRAFIKGYLLPVYVNLRVTG